MGLRVPSCQALLVFKHHHSGIGGCLPRARLEGCPVKGQRPWTQTQETPGAGGVSSPGLSFPSVIVCAPIEAGVAGTR